MNKTNKTKVSHRIIALLLTLTFLPSLVPVNMLLASNNGPTTPEAASFEPVDATDMVNLSTGSVSYVLPLMNVPSPEGGYPLALAYHAGIAMDQEASWVGLGWNLNPGAINRSVNGYADDYNAAQLTEYFYDEGGSQEVYSLSLGFTSNAGASVGLGLSWGSNLSLGGTVSIGYGYDIASGGSVGGSLAVGRNSGLSIGGTTAGGLSLGASISGSGLNGSVGIQNDAGFKIGASSSGNLNLGYSGETGNGNKFSTGLNLSSSGVGIQAGVTNISNSEVVGGMGAGLQVAFANTAKMGDYVTKSTGYNIPLVVPTPIGFFSLSFGKQKFRYFLGKKEENYVNGPLHFNNGTFDDLRYYVHCYQFGAAYQIVNCYEDIVDTAAERDQIFQQYSHCNCYDSELTDESFMDINEFSIDSELIASSTDVAFNNPAFPNYDYYNVQAQGLSGGMSSRLYEYGALFGLSNKGNSQNFSLDYGINGSSTAPPAHTLFSETPNFYFDNEISTYLSVSEPTFDTSTSGNTVITDYYAGSTTEPQRPRRRTGNYIEYYTNEEILNNYSTLKNLGYLEPSVTGFDRGNKPLQGVGAFKITASDGKTYHYSLPVYNHETVTRTFGVIKHNNNAPKTESESYFEKRQLEPYATHWLLTAVTGPDYIDKNTNGFADKGDYGYWVNFDYGKWSDAFIWQSPFGEDHLTSPDDEDIKTWIRGRKEMYYLDKVETRTHTALFVKEERLDGRSIAWTYTSVDHIDDLDQDSGDFVNRFTIPAQNPLRLKKVILVNEEDDSASKTYGPSPSQGYSIVYNDSQKPGETVYINQKDNVLDTGDNISSLQNKIVKSVELNYDNSLVSGTPNAIGGFGRSTLLGVNFKGKQDIQLLPPYTFEYEAKDLDYNGERRDNYGYYDNLNEAWSLRKINTPDGGQLEIEYETNKFKSITNRVEFTDSGQYISEFDSNNFSITDIRLINNTTDDLGVLVNDKVNIKYSRYDCVDANNTYEYSYEGLGTVDQILGTGVYLVTPDGTQSVQQIPGPCWFTGYSLNNSLEVTYYPRTSTLYEQGGVRAKSITASDGSNSFKTTYSYGENKNGWGYVSYLPFKADQQLEIPYSAELPAPRVMYEYVSVATEANGLPPLTESVYKFNVMKEKSQTAIKYGDFYEVTTTRDNTYTDGSGREIDIKGYTIKDNLASIGQLLEVKTLNFQSQLMGKMVNEYYTTQNVPVWQGKESYQSYKEVDYNTGTDKWMINGSSRIRYPNMLKSTTEYRNGFSHTTEFLDLDAITGQATRIRTTSAKGEEMNAVSIPAYTIPSYGEMGSKVDGAQNKNMLVQSAMSKTYYNGTSDVVSVGVTTWKPFQYTTSELVGTPPNQTTLNKTHNIWRKHKNYTWQGTSDSQGIFTGYNDGNDDGFDWSLEVNDQDVAQSTEWKQLSEVTAYNPFSNPLEVMDVGGNLTSTKMGDGDSKVFASAATASAKFFYSGAEDLQGSNFSGGVQKGTASLTTNSHTGSSALQVDPGESAFRVTVENGTGSARKYKASLWTLTGNYSNVRVNVGGTNVTHNADEVIPSGSWTQLNFYFDIQNSKVIYVTTAGSSITVDDFRVHPVEVDMTSYVYNQWDELSAILGRSNMATTFEYDEMGRLLSTFAEVADAPSFTGGIKKVSENKYNYKVAFELDTNSNGVIDGNEGYSDLDVDQDASNGYSNTGTLTTLPSGGSGNYRYSYAKGTVTSLAGVQALNNYGSESTNNQFTVSVTIPCSGGSYGWNAYAVKTKVRDVGSGETKVTIAYYNKSCPDGGGGGGGTPVQ
ncbi:hypothetical protein GTQ34_16000 [Muricauda sp. JGD-17]|uniref:YD repeat-containing protein n=1 Tax=Flagellimonas ochracea TaxID=2696472 RepID=A0A964WZ49_9FLAO|nr:hypothetical protein [Allomuricauda ochracea]NAY93414.1 hypothetical protein [Allomuricauda ochracea]